ncbi:MAG: GntR family transcriptional regulator [Bacteroidetes bacterium]|nr:GntR family transcriptional regulator [Bacteroidota bacterium]
MEFNEKNAIYQQIVEYAMDQILTGGWKTEEKIHSVRELAAILQVNPNTVMRAYEHLQQKEIIVNRRGIGTFVAADAESRIRSSRRNNFLSNDLPGLFRRMEMLGLGMEELEKEYWNYLKTVKHEKK